MTNPDPVASLLASAPELANNPGLAADALNSPDPASTGQVLSHTNAITQVQAHVKRQAGIGGFFHDFTPQFVKDGGNFAMTQLSRPLGEVQHEYRYIHDVFERHGVAAGLLSIIPAAVGGVGVGLLTGGIGATLGAEGGMALWNKLGLGYEDSYNHTADGASYRDSAGHLVSPGRDFADIADYVTGGATGHYGQGGFNVISGAADAAFDLSLDPLIKGGALSNSVKLEGLRIGEKTLITGRGVKASDMVGQVVLDAAGKPLFDAPGVVKLRRPSVLDAAEMPADRLVDIYNANGGVKDMVKILAKPETTTDVIMNNYPKLSKLSVQLGKATTDDDVLNVFRDAITSKNYSAISGGLPTTGITRRPISLGTQVHNAMLNVGAKDSGLVSGVTGQAIETPNPIIRALTTTRAFNISDAMESLSSKKFNPADDSSVDTVKQLMLQSQNTRTANAIAANYANGDLAERLNILGHAVPDMARAYGIPDDAQVITKWSGDLHKMLTDAASPVYGVDRNGAQIILKDRDGADLNMGLLLNQQGTIAIPSYSEMRKALREGGTKNLLSPLLDGAGRLDEWTYSHFTTKFFKPLALMSLGFAQRVATGELVPATIKLGASPIAKGVLRAATERLNPGLGLQLNDENALKLTGVRVSVDDPVHAGRLRRKPQGGNLDPAIAGAKPGTGIIRDVDSATKTANVSFAGFDTEVPLDQLTAYHHEISDNGIRMIARKAGMNFDRDEVGNIRAAAGVALHGVSKALFDDDYAKMAHLNVMNFGGHGVAPALTSGHGSHVYQGVSSVNDALKSVGKALRDQKKQFSSSFSYFGGESDLHPVYWQRSVQEAGADQGVRRGATAYLEELKADPNDIATARLAFIKADSEYMAKQPAYIKSMAGAKIDLQAYSEARAQLFEGQVYSRFEPNRVFHQNVADAIASGTTPSLQELMKVDQKLRPMVKGRTEEDIPHEATLQNVINTGYRRVLEPIINGISREPIFTTLSTKHFKDLKPMVEAGFMDEGQAAYIAAQRAVPEMLPLIHNTELRSQFSELTSNYMPFYFAQEQAYKRYANAILSSPQAFERYRLGVHALNSSGIMQQDSSGQSSVVFPGVGNLTDGVTKAAGVFGIGATSGIPSQVSGNISSLKSVLPGGLMGNVEGPGVSPLVAIASHAIESFFPKSEPYISGIIGPISQSQSLSDELMPNAFIRHIIQVTPLGDRSRSFQTAFYYAVQNAKMRSDVLRSKGDIKGADAILPGAGATLQDRQKAVDRLRSSTKVLWTARAVFGLVSPMAPRFDVGDFKLRADLQKSITDAVAAKQPPGTGVLNFLAKNPDATADTVFLSNGAYTGTNVPAGQAALDWVNANRSFVAGHPMASAYLVPQTTDFSQEAYNQELAVGLRVRRTPEQFTDQLYAASTNAVFYPALAEKNAMIASDPSRKTELNTAFRAFTLQLAAQNPTWDKVLNDPTRKATAHDALLELNTALAPGGGAPDSPQAAGIRSLITDYQSFAQQEVQMKNAGESTQALTQSWHDYLTNLSKTNQVLQPVVDGVFRKLPSYDIFSSNAQAA